MAVTVDQANAGTRASTGSATTTLTTTATLAAGSHAIVLLHIFAGALTHTVSGGGLTWTQAHVVVSGTIRMSLWYAPCPAGLASSTALTVGSPTGTTGDITAVIASYLGIDTTGTVVAFNGGTAATAAWSTGSVTGNSGDALIGGSGGDGSSGGLTSTPSGGTVERIDFGSVTSGAQVTLTDKLSVAGSDTLTGTWSGALTHLTVGVAFAAAADGGGATDVTRPTFNAIPFMR